MHQLQYPLDAFRHTEGSSRAKRNVHDDTVKSAQFGGSSNADTLQSHVPDRKASLESLKKPPVFQVDSRSSSCEK